MGRELVPLLQENESYQVNAPTHEKLDIATPFGRGQIHRDTDLIVHCAAYTNVEKANIERKLCWDTNVVGTKNLSAFGIPMLYISTEYVFDGQKGMYSEDDQPNPQGFYALTKTIGEHQIGMDSKVVRLVLKPRPWKYPNAFCDQWTSGDYVDVMAKELVKVISVFDKLPRIIHIGTGRKSIYDLAKQTRDVGTLFVSGAMNPRPRDTSLDCSVWERIKLENGL